MCSGSACQQRAIKTEVVDSRDGRGTYLGVELSLAPRTYTDLLWVLTHIMVQNVQNGNGWWRVAWRVDSIHSTVDSFRV